MSSLKQWQFHRGEKKKKKKNQYFFSASVLYTRVLVSSLKLVPQEHLVV